VTIATETFWLADRNKDRQPAPQKDSRANQPGFVVLARFFDTLCCRWRFLQRAVNHHEVEEQAKTKEFLSS